MKSSARIVFIAIMASIALFIIGLYCWGDIFEILLPDVGNAKYVADNFTDTFKNSIYFGLILASIPIMTILVWKFAPILNTKRKILTVFVIVFTLLTSILMRSKMVEFQAKSLQPIVFENHIPLSTLKFELFALAGVLFGTAVSFYTLREKAN